MIMNPSNVVPKVHYSVYLFVAGELRMTTMGVLQVAQLLAERCHAHTFNAPPKVISRIFAKSRLLTRKKS
jgi:hypothetical protein